MSNRRLDKKWRMPQRLMGDIQNKILRPIGTGIFSYLKV
jgi:hypothetical protein